MFLNTVFVGTKLARSFQTEFLSWTSTRNVRATLLVFSRIWRAWPQFLTGCPQACLAQNFLFGLAFRAWENISQIGEYSNQDVGKGGLSLREVAVTTETATTAETAKTVTAASWNCILWEEAKGG